MEPEFESSLLVNNITAYVDFSLNNKNESFPIFFDMDILSSAASYNTCLPDKSIGVVGQKDVKVLP